MRWNLCTINELLPLSSSSSSLASPFFFPRILQHQLDRLANQMSPAQLVFAEQTLVGRVIVGHADAVEESSKNARCFGLLAGNSAAKQHMLGRRENPRVAGFCPDFSAGFVNVHNHLQSDQFGNGIMLLLPVVGQLSQQ